MTPRVCWTALMAGQGYIESIMIVINCMQICPQGGQLQPAGCDECSDVKEGLQGRGGPTAEDAAQHPPQG